MIMIRLSGGSKLNIRWAELSAEYQIQLHIIQVPKEQSGRYSALTLSVRRIVI